MSAPALDALLTLDEASEWLRMNAKVLLQKTRGRKPMIPCIRFGRKGIRFHPRTILAKFAAEQGVSESLIAAAFTQAKLIVPQEAMHHAE